MRSRVHLLRKITWLLLLTSPTDAFQTTSSLTGRSLAHLKSGERTAIPHTCSTTRTSTSTALYSSVVITTALTAIDSFWSSSPYAAAALVCGIKASAADLVAQKRDYRKRAEKTAKKDEIVPAKATTELQASSLQEDSTPVIYNPNFTDEDEDSKDTKEEAQKKADYKRNLAFLIYGSLYQGVTQEHVYNHLYPVWFGSGTGMTVVLTKVLFDLLIQTTLVTLPIAYLTKSIIYRYSFKEAIRRYVDDIRNHGLLKKYYLLWGPVQCITFSIVPEHWRVTFIACVSFFWLIILSSIASRAKPSAAADQEETVVDELECSLEDGLTCNIDG